MKIRLFILLFCFFGTLSFAQKYGVDLGCGYTANNFKLIPKFYPNYGSTRQSLKQKHLSSFFFCSYFKVYKNVFLGTGLDHNKYDFSYSRYSAPNGKKDYSVRIWISDIHVPIMLRMEVIRFKQKHPLSLYGGIFARFPAWKRTRVLWTEEGYELIPNENSNADIKVTIFEKKQRYTNFMFGVHQSFMLAPWLHAYADFKLKYMAGDFFFDYDTTQYSIEYMYLQNKLTYTFSLGISFIKPEKEKTESANPSRLED